MDDLGKGVGKGVGGLGGCLLPALALLIVFVAAAAVPVMAAEGKAGVSTVKGDRYRMADAKMAQNVTRYADPADDQLRLDGTPEPEAPAWSDLRTVYVAPTRVPPKLLTKMRSDHPPGAAGAFYGDAASPEANDRVVFVAAEMAKPLPDGVRGQQVEVGFGGDAATPVQAGTDHVTWAGTERFTLAGVFSNGAFAAGATNVAGREPGLDLAVDEYYDARSGAFGFYSSKRSTWYLVVPRPADADVITVSVRSTTGVGNVVDRLDLPSGGHFVDLRDRTGGFDPAKGLPTLGCRSLETYSHGSGLADVADAGSSLVRYTAGVATTVQEDVAAELLGRAIEAAGPVSIELSAVGAEDEAEPLLVEGDLSVLPAGNAVSLTFEAPAGQWSFGLAGDAAPTTPAGERIVDHMTLTGTAGFAVGPGLDGYVAGDLECTGALSGTGETSAAEDTSAAEEPDGPRKTAVDEPAVEESSASDEEEPAA